VLLSITLERQLNTTRTTYQQSDRHQTIHHRLDAVIQAQAAIAAPVDASPALQSPRAPLQSRQEESYGRIDWRNIRVTWQLGSGRLTARPDTAEISSCWRS
jgi:hypothetical protein